MLQGFAAINKHLSSGGVLTGYGYDICILITDGLFDRYKVIKMMIIVVIQDIK